MTLQEANIARDGRHMVTPCSFSDVQGCKPHWTAKRSEGGGGPQEAGLWRTQSGVQKPHSQQGNGRAS